MVRDFIEEVWKTGWSGRTLLFISALVLMLIPIIVLIAIEEDKQWTTFKIKHDCKIVGKMTGDTFTTVGPNLGGGGGGIAIGIGSTPGKTGWQCDDGIMYWR